MMQFFIGCSIAVLVHELGHAAFMWLFKIPVTLIEWGKGPRLLKFKAFEIRLLLLGGGVYPAGSELADRKWKGVLIALGGIIAQWIVTIIIARAGLHKVEWLTDVVIWFVAASLLALLNLIPYRGTDGYDLIRVLTRKEQQS